MTDALTHRGPDTDGYFCDEFTALGFRRLSIIDLASGAQPMYNEDRSLVLICNGEIFNYRELRDAALGRGHTFYTQCDVEVLLHLYEDYGADLLRRVNGQFAFALYDRRNYRLMLARDQVGVCPLYYTQAGDHFIFASEIKAILEHPQVRRGVDLTGLDQVLSFPGQVSPRTLFEGISSLKCGSYLMIENGQTRLRKYWDLNYPLRDEVGYREDENYYVESLRERLFASVKRRLQADVEVGFYLSGGLDSSLIAATIHQVSPGISRHSFSIAFHEKDITETKYQRLIARKLETVHHEIVVDREQILSNLLGMLYYCEAPVKETYNTCCLALSKAARNNGVSVVLTGEGADELFAGYPGYRFDGFGFRPSRATPLEAAIEEELRTKVWGDHNFFYEGSLSELREIKTAFYSEALSRRLEDFDCFNHPLIDRDQLRGRHEIHKRAYLDFYLRLSDHLITDHGDRMAMANSVEARYPFLDIDLIEFSLLIPPNLKLNGLTEKYILKKAAQGLTPQEIIQREKFGFHAPGTPYLLQAKLEWVWDLLSCERIRKDGYFNPQVIESLKKQYSKPGFKLNLPYETDYLMIVLSFNLLLDIFRLPRLN